MDWLKQSEEMLTMWTDTQQKMMSNWLSSMKNFTGPGASGVWEKTLDTWERAVNNMLETQAQWARMWAGSVTATKGASQETIQGAAQMKELTERWIEFQRDLWQNWFEMARQLDLTNVAGGTPEAAFQSWQESLQQAMEAQQSWIKTWMAGQKSEE